MNKEFRDWLEEKKKLTGRMRGTERSDGMRIAYFAVADKYDALHKQVVIPKCVADFIEDIKPNKSLRVAFGHITQRKADSHDDPLAFWVEEGNSETFARAWLDGYEVEEEPKYNVRVPHTETSSYYSRGKGGLALSRWTGVERLRGGDFIFTEQEIKELLPDIPKKYWEEVK